MTDAFAQAPKPSVSGWLTQGGSVRHAKGITKTSAAQMTPKTNAVLTSADIIEQAQWCHNHLRHAQRETRIPPMQSNSIYEIKEASLLLGPKTPTLTLECHRPGLMVSIPLGLDKARQLMEICKLDLSKDACAQLAGTYVTIDIEPKMNGRAHTIGNVFGTNGIPLSKPVEPTRAQKNNPQTR